MTGRASFEEGIGRVSIVLGAVWAGCATHPIAAVPMSFSALRRFILVMSFSDRIAGEHPENGSGYAEENDGAESCAAHERDEPRCEDVVGAVDRRVDETLGLVTALGIDSGV